MKVDLDLQPHRSSTGKHKGFHLSHSVHFLTKGRLFHRQLFYQVNQDSLWPQYEFGPHVAKNSTNSEEGMRCPFLPVSAPTQWGDHGQDLHSFTPPTPVSPWLEFHHSRGKIKKKPTPLTHALILWPKEAKMP